MHRKLFPASTTTNQTQDCSDFCDPACPYNCYSYPVHYFPPPPISPPSIQISSYLAIAASLFTVVFVLVGFYVLKVKCYSDWCGWRRNGSFSTQSGRLVDEFVGENQVDHRIWLITTFGLQQSIINSITVSKYKKGEGLIDGTECSVCLSEFKEDETLRVLPKCNHAFHIPCIDTWLSSHINCPLCRAPIVPSNASSNAAILNASSMEENSVTAVRNEYAQVEREGGESISMVSENREGTRQEGETEDFTHESILKTCTDSDEDKQIVDGIRKGTNSASMDSSVDHINGDIERHTVNLLKKDGEYSTLFKSARRSSVSQCLHVTPISMKRSAVSCCGRIASTGGYRSLNSSLPHQYLKNIKTCTQISST